MKLFPNIDLNKQSKFELLILIICAVAVVTLLYMPISILPLIMDSYAMPISMVNISLGVFSFSYAVGFLIFGPLSDKIGRKIVLVSGLCLLSIITFILFWIKTYEYFILVRAFQGFIAASFPPVALAYLAECNDDKQRAWNIAWMSTAFLSTGILGQLYGSVVASYLGFNWSLMPLMTIYLVTAFIILLIPKKATNSQNNNILYALLEGYRPIVSLLNNHLLRSVYLPSLLILMSFVTFYMSLDIHLGDELKKEGISLIVARSIALPAFIATLMAAKLINRFGAYQIANVGLTIAALGLALCAVVSKLYIYYILIFSLIFVVGVAITVPALIARIHEATTSNNRGLAVSLYTFLLFVGASLGPILTTYSTKWHFHTLLIFLSVSLCCTVIYSCMQNHKIIDE